MTPKVSVLMPSLNVVDYIDECMESVLSQTLVDIEVICIDAGSTDGTLEKLEEYSNGDERVTLLLSDVRSYGHQMNMGLDAAHGDYIGIVETDDWAERDMFERLWGAAVAHDADFVKASYFNYWSTPTVRNEPVYNFSSCQYGSVFCPLDQWGVLAVASSIWSGLYRREMLLNEGIRFNETPGASFQDTSFHFMVCSVAKRMLLLEEPVLHYRRDNDSSSVNSGGKAFFICDEMRYFEAFLDTRPELKALLETSYIPVKFNKYRWNYHRLSPVHQWAFLERVYEEFSAHERDGLVDRTLFDAGRYRELRHILDDRVSFYTDTCKTYGARPQGIYLPEVVELTSCPTGDVDVSVIVCVSGADALAKGGILPVLGSCRTSAEVLCVCDGAYDALDALMSLSADDPCLRVLSQVREGSSAAWNHGARHSRGRYVLFLDEGDALVEGTIETLVEVADESHADIVLVGPASSADDDPSVCSVVAGTTGGCLSILSDGGVPFEGGSAIFVRREFFEEKTLRFPDGCDRGEIALFLDALAVADAASLVRGDLIRRGKGSGSEFERIYGDLSYIPRIIQLASMLPYERAFQEAVSRGLDAVILDLHRTFFSLKDKKSCIARLTPVERQSLQVLLDHVRAGEAENELEVARRREREAKTELEVARRRERNIARSVSFRIGRALTFPLRKIRDLVRSK